MDLETAAEMAMALPELTEGVRYGNRTWMVDDKAFAWERPFGAPRIAARASRRAKGIAGGAQGRDE